jgi:succinoglycan biosynthesis protein ExoM
VKLLVGIPTHRRPELLRACLDSIAVQEGDLPEIAVFVADNDPLRREGRKVAEQLAPTFRFPLSSIIVEEPGISAVRNAILKEARRSHADFIAMIDDDETASEGWLRALLKVQVEYVADVVGGPVKPLFPGSVPEWLKPGFARRKRATGRVDLVDATSSVLISCRALEAVGWPAFESAYGLTGGGDTEFFLRARDSGMTFGWSNDALVYESFESERLSAGWVLRRNFRYGTTRIRLSRAYRMENTPTFAWVAFHLAASPFLLILAIHPKLRIKALNRIAYASGLLAGIFGMKYHEYASRH